MRIFYATQWLIVLLVLVTLSLYSMVAQAAGAGFAMVSNERFGAQAVGLAEAIPVEVGSAGVTTRADVVHSALRGRELSLASRAHAEQALRRLHLLGAQTRLTRSLIAAPMRHGRLAIANSGLPAAKATTRGTAPLTFKFQGFPTDTQTALQTFAQQLYPLLVQVYGDPAPQQRGKVVTVVSDAASGDGVYMLPAQGDTSSGGKILINIGTDITPEQNNFNLTQQMLLAFHGPVIFAFDAWELGFSAAAALVADYLSTLR